MCNPALFMCCSAVVMASSRASTAATCASGLPNGDPSGVGPMFPTLRSWYAPAPRGSSVALHLRERRPGAASDREMTGRET